MLYDENLKSLCQPITKVKGQINIYAYEFDTIKLTGYTEENPKDAYVFRLNYDDGTEIYSGFVKKLTKKNNTIELIGRDLREWLNTEIIIDFLAFPPPTTMAGIQEAIIYFFDVMADQATYTFNARILGTLDLRPINMFGDYTDQIIYENAWQFLLPFFKYFDYRVDKCFDIVAGLKGDRPLIFEFHPFYNVYEIKLNDFAYELKQTEPEVNKAIAVMENTEFGYEWKKQERFFEWEFDGYEWIEGTPTDTSTKRYIPTGRGRTEYEFMLYYVYSGVPVFPVQTIWLDIDRAIIAPAPEYEWRATGNQRTVYEYRVEVWAEKWKDVDPLETQWSTTKPDSDDPNYRWWPTGNVRHQIGAISYFYLTKDNQIYAGDHAGNDINGNPISNRYYPIKTKIFSDPYLANAQFKAILELCNNRWVDNIWLDNNDPRNPIDLSDVEIMDRFYIYTEDGFYKMLPVSEIELKLTENSIQKRIKLGFKKEKLTDFIRGLGM